jgi:FAS-associated factor 2
MMEEDLQIHSMLTPTQQQTLRSFQEITQVTDEYLALQILQQNGWMLEPSLSTFMHDGMMDDNESEDEYEVAESPYQQQQDLARPQHSLPSRVSSTLPANQGVGGTNVREVLSPVQNNNNNDDEGGSLLDLLFVPLRWLFQTRSATIDTNQDVHHFISEFRAQYGPNHPAFHVGSYQSAVSAAFDSTKFVLVYLHSPLHEDADRFCQEVLMSSEFLALASDQMIVWGGKIWDAEPYGLSTQLNAAAFPFLALLIPQSSRVVQIVERVQGFEIATTVVEKLRSAMNVFSAVVSNQRAEQHRRDESSRLREQQNREYQEAVESERQEAVRRRQQEEERIAAEEKKRAEEEEAAAIALSQKLFREDAIRKIRTAFADEAEPKGSPDVATIRFQLPRAKKLTRNFWKYEKIQKLHDYLKLNFVDEGDLTTNFAMFIPHPRTEISNMEQTVEEAGLHPRGMLYVQDLDT